MASRVLSYQNHLREGNSRASDEDMARRTGAADLLVAVSRAPETESATPGPFSRRLRRAAHERTATAKRVTAGSGVRYSRASVNIVLVVAPEARSTGRELR